MNQFMEKAIELANKADKIGEVPIGAVVEKNGKIIACGFNKREKTKNALMHAEIIAISKACKKLKDWRLEGCTMFVTLEPCPMCAGAILNARLSKVFYGAKDKTAQDDLLDKISTSTRLNHNCEFVQLDEYEKPCADLLSKFFKDKRKNTK